MRLHTIAVLLVAAVLGAADPPGDWPVYGRDPGGQRFSPLKEINRDNVKALKAASGTNAGWGTTHPPFVPPYNGYDYNGDGVVGTTTYN